MFRIKICGVTSVDDARAAIGAGGCARIQLLSFKQAVHRSRSRNKLPTSCQISGKVGVFVNHSAREIQDASNLCNHPIYQLHGDEPAELLTELARRDKNYSRISLRTKQPRALALSCSVPFGRTPDASYWTPMRRRLAAPVEAAGLDVDCSSVPMLVRLILAGG
jgi:phosphoribosylanthranilate isomerase